MKTVVTLFASMLLCVSAAFAQSNPLLKKLADLSEMRNSGKSEKAEEKLVRMLEDHPDFSEGWETLVAWRGENWEKMKQVRLEKGETKFTITTKDEKGRDVSGAADSLGQLLAKMLNSYSPAESARSKYMYTIRKALLQAPEAYQSSMAWRMYNVDPEVDSLVSSKAIRYYNEAEKEYAARNFNAAAKLYRRALEEQPDFYKAALYLGDAFYGSENYADALVSFKDAVNRFPDLLEPQKYLCDAYVKLKLYDKAVEAAINALTVYPDVSMFSKLDNAAYQMNKTLSIKWTPRPIFPNKIPKGKNSADGDFSMNEFNDQDELKPTGPWVYYANALKKAQPYCNANGIVNDAKALNGVQYLEVYSWLEMLKASKDESLAEARRMQEAGFLDCYVLVSCYHPDIYQQYRDFASKNKEKIVHYFQAMLKDIN